MKNVVTLALTFLLCTGCTAQWGKRIKGNGVTTTIERTTDAYDEVAISGWFDIDLVDGKEGEITLTGEENLLPYIITEVKNGQLIIKVEKGQNLQPSNWNRGIKILVPVESINGVSLSGSGDIVGKKTIKSDRFETSMSGSGDITLTVETRSMNAQMSGSGDMNLSGKTVDFSASISGSGDIKAYDLNADHVEATISGSADIKVTANKSIKARVSGSGDISYKGNPEKIDTKSSGSGDISKG